MCLLMAKRFHQLMQINLQCIIQNASFKRMHEMNRTTQESCYEPHITARKNTYSNDIKFFNQSIDQLLSLSSLARYVPTTSWTKYAYVCNVGMYSVYTICCLIRHMDEEKRIPLVKETHNYPTLTK